MSITVTLDPSIEKTIESKAARVGMTVSEYVGRLVERSARPKPSRTRKSNSPTAISPEALLRGIIERADPVELKAHGITLAKHAAKTGAELLRNLRSAGLLNGYGDPEIDSLELARQLREQAQTRDWS